MPYASNHTYSTGAANYVAGNNIDVGNSVASAPTSASAFAVNTVRFNNTNQTLAITGTAGSSYYQRWCAGDPLRHRRRCITGAAITAGNNTMNFIDYGSLTVKSQIQGAGSVSVAGTGVTTFTGDNIYTGVTYVQQGATLSISNNNQLGQHATAAALNLAGTLLVTGNVTLDNYGINNRPINIGSTDSTNPATINVASGNTLNVPSVISSNTALAASLTKTGPGLLVLSGPNLYAAGYAGSVSLSTTLVSGGVLRANDGAGLPNSTLLSLNGGVFETAQTFTRFLGNSFGQVNLPGGASGFSANGGAVTIALGGAVLPAPLQWGRRNFSPSSLVLNAATANNTLNLVNSIDLNGAVRSIALNAPAGAAMAATISGVLSNSSTTPAGLTTTGTGDVILTAANTYNGPTSIGNGNFSLASGASLGNTAITVNNGSNLIPASGTSAGSTGAGTLGATLTVANGGKVTLSGATGSFAVNQQNSFTGSAHPVQRRQPYVLLG